MKCNNCGSGISVWQTGYKVGNMSVCSECHKTKYDELKQKEEEKSNKSFIQTKEETKEWFYAKENEQIGPIGKNELLKLIKQDEVKGRDLVWTQGMEDWRKSKEVDILQTDLDTVSLSDTSNINEQEITTFDALESNYFWSMIIIGSLITSIIISFITGGGGFRSVGGFGELIGQAIGLIIYPGVLTLIITGLMRLFKKEVSSEKFNVVFLILWVFLLLPSLVGSFLVT